jgi:putative ABC transport system permease protein
MFRLSLKQVLAHRFRLTLTLLAVTLGVTFVTGSLVLTDTSQQLFDDQFATAGSGTDVTVKSSVAFDSAMGVEVDRDPLPASLLRRIVGVEGVAEAQPVAAGSGLLQVAGEPIVPSGPSTLASWEPGPTSPYRLRAGRAPGRAGDLVVDVVTAREHGISIGDTVAVQARTTDTLTVVGLAGFGDQDGVPNSTIALTTLAEAQRLLSLGDRYSSVEVTAAPGIASTTLQERIASELGPKYAATSSQDTAAAGVAAAKDRLAYLRLMLVILAAAALLIGAFLISNTFSIVITQRTRELAVLRAAGATGGQVFRLVFGEALLVGLAGSTAGVLVGIGAAVGLRDLVGGFGVAVPDGSVAVLPRSLAVAFALGVVVTVVAALAPSRNAGRVAPLQALRESATDPGTGRARVVAGSFLTALSFAATAAVVLAGAGAAWLGVSAASLVVGLALLGRLVPPRWAGALGRATRPLGLSGLLAGEFAARAPRRTAATVLALGLSLALIAFMGVLGSSVKAAIASTYREVVTADYVIESARGEMLGGLAPAVYERVRHLPQVALASRTQYGHWKDGASTSALTAVDPQTIGQVTSLHMTAGHLDALARGGVVLARHVAEDRGLDVGDRLPMTFARTGTRSLPVVGLLDDGDAQALSTNYIIGADTYRALFAERMDASVYVSLRDGVDAQAAERAIRAAIQEYATADLRDQAAAVEGRTASIDQILGLVTVLLLFTVLIAMLGIMNTLALSIVERTREIGLLRAVGMTRRQLRTMVRAESLIIAALAVVLGLGIGVGLAAAAVSALGRATDGPVVVPAGWLFAVTAVALATGLLAGLLPARRAARLNVLDAISTP